MSNDCSATRRVAKNAAAASLPGGGWVAWSPARCAFCIVALTCLAYRGSFAGVFVCDDIFEIAQNPAIDQLWPPWRAMFRGYQMPARPLPYLSFAIDMAVWGRLYFGYHLTNLVVHVVAALALFDLARQTLLSPRLRDRFGLRANFLSLVIAVLWALHPLQTQAVTYVYQRIESMAGMFCLLSLAAFARAAATNWSRKWLCGAVMACAAAMACKENAVVLPVLLVLYDWLFTPADSPAAWRADVRRRRGLHCACFLTWLILAFVIWTQAGRYQEFNVGTARHSPLTYALTQPGVILHYLRLAFVPVGQCFDYGGWTGVATPRVANLPAYAAIVAAVGLTIRGAIRREPWAWLGLFFFGTLAPTSSVMPIEAFANEHRMYLPLAAVVAAVVLSVASLGTGLGAELGARFAGSRPGSRRRLARAGLLAAVAAAIVLALLTDRRNRVYRSQEALWADVLERDPGNYRGLSQHALIRQRGGDHRAAFDLAERALRSNPSGDIFSRLATHALADGDAAAAERLLRRGLERQRAALPPDDRAVLRTTANLAACLSVMGRVEEAAELCSGVIADMRRVLGAADVATQRAEQFIAAGLPTRGGNDQGTTETRDAEGRAAR